MVCEVDPSPKLPPLRGVNFEVGTLPLPPPSMGGLDFAVNRLTGSSATDSSAPASTSQFRVFRVSFTP